MNSRRSFLRKTSLASALLFTAPHLFTTKSYGRNKAQLLKMRPENLKKSVFEPPILEEIENIVFSRPSSATYFNSSGVLSYANQNLLTYSEDIKDGSWSKTGTTAGSTSSVNAPDGSKTAQVLTETSARSEHRLSRNVAVNQGLNYTFSIHLKAGSCTKVRVSFMNAANYTGGNPNFFFNMATGAITNKTANVINSSVVNEGDGWWRVSITGKPDLGAISGFQIFMLNTSEIINYSGSGKNFYLWGAQFEAGSSPSSYFATTSKPFSGERYNYDPATRKLKGLMVEPAATNFVRQSGKLSDTSAWLFRATTVQANKFESPDGNVNAVKLVEDSTTNSHFMRPVIKPVVTRGQVYTFSVFIRPAERKWVYLNLDGSTAHFNLTDGIVSRSVNPLYLYTSIQEMGNGWFRCSGTIIATGTEMDTTIGVEVSENERQYRGNGSSGIYVWGPQLETGIVATSYIPTGASTATRGGEICRLLPPTTDSHDILLQRTNGGLWADDVTSSFIVPASGYELQTGSFWDVGTTDEEKEDIVDTLFPSDYVNAGFTSTKLTIFSNTYRVQSPDKSWSVNYAKNKTSQIHRFQLRSGDQWASDAGKDKERAELYSLDKMPFSQDVWLSYAVRVAEGPAVTSKFCHLGQFHATEDQNEVASVPVLTFRFNGNDDLSVTTCANTAKIATTNTSGVVRYTGKLKRGIWVRNVLRIRFHHTNGQVEWWENGVKKLDLSGVGIGNNDTVGPYWKYGLYRTKSPETLTVEYANMELSTTTSLRSRIESPLLIL
ncbi:heparin lyase I family protein [Dyadobacter sp. NIV53]|uniref:phage head spike fiber domain-containing protein n=1 Tax=Dyadobacter sp. NIV53 TaxID=2861765 RepID=UPI001C87B5C7|nr:heparin lyase I family protein [Dyadobacter sp. NIV53]